ncbi:MAG: hypothetical protein LBR00_04910, partial [Clostridiales Family XIII bacterium]|nr:hypothetical protein [Clostridiales Family XIII bacterium]
MNFLAIEQSVTKLIACVKDDGIDDDGIIGEAAAHVRAHGFDGGIVSVEEITTRHIKNLIRKANRSDFIDEEESWFVKYELKRMTNNEWLDSSGFYGDESVCGAEPIGEEQALAETAKMLAPESLRHEIKNIFAVTRNAYKPGHPVMYTISYEDSAELDAYAGLLVRCLKSCKRVASGRVRRIQYKDLCEDYYSDKLEATFRHAVGGTIIVSVEKDMLKDANYLTGYDNRAEELCEAVMRHKNNVLTVFGFPRGMERQRAAFLRALDGVSIVGLEERIFFDEQARGFLRDYAKTFDARPNRGLYLRVEQGHGYSKIDLKRLFDRWYDDYLRRHVYTQYGTQVELFTRKDAGAQGGAIVELESLIGLSETKKLVKEILAFATVQKRFAVDTQGGGRAMHMIFTGNPGSAKTTVARLVARV